MGKRAHSLLDTDDNNSDQAFLDTVPLGALREFRDTVSCPLLSTLKVQSNVFRVLFRADCIVICQIGGTTSYNTSGSCPPSSSRVLGSILKTGIECRLPQMVARVSITGQKGRLAHV